jgi:hypothetical protein
LTAREQIMTMPRMSRSLFLAVFLFACGVAHAADEQQISFVGDGKAFNVVAVASGEAQYKPPFLRVTLDEAVARATDVMKAGEHIYGYRIGIVHTIAGGQWEPIRWSSAIKVDSDIGIKQSISLPTPQIAIPIDGLADVKDDWLVLELDFAGDDSRTTYAHSAKLMVQ